MLNFGITFPLVTALVAGNVPASTVPTVWSNDSLRISHAAEVIAQDKDLCYIETDDGNVWGIYGELDTSRLYAVVFDTRDTEDINDDRILLAVAMD